MRHHVTDALEIVGLILFVAAGAVAAWQVTPAAGLAAGGAGCLIASVLLIVSALGTRKAPKR